MWQFCRKSRITEKSLCLRVSYTCVDQHHTVSILNSVNFNIQSCYVRIWNSTWYSYSHDPWLTIAIPLRLGLAAELITHSFIHSSRTQVVRLSTCLSAYHQRWGRCNIQCLHKWKYRNFVHMENCHPEGGTYLFHLWLNLCIAGKNFTIPHSLTYSIPERLREINVINIMCKKLHKSRGLLYLL